MRSKSYIGKRFNRIKLYKKGKMWVAASITVFSLGITGTVAHADNLNATVSSSSVSQKLIEGSSSNRVKTTSQVINSSKQETASLKTSSKAKVAETTSRLSLTSSSSQQTQSSSLSEQTSSQKSSSLTVSESSSNSKGASSASKSISSQGRVSNSSSTLTKGEVRPENGNETNGSTDNLQVIGEKGENALNNLELPDKEKLLNNQDLINKLKDMPAIVNRENDKNNLAAAATSAGDNARGMFDDASDFDHFGNWTIYFQDEYGNEIYPVDGYSNAGPNYVNRQVTKDVNNIIDEGYEYVGIDYTQSYAFDTINGYYTFITLVFKELPPQPGGKVTVNYETQDGKLLGSTTASYQTLGGETDPEPHVNDVYTSVIKKFKGYHIAEVPSNAYGTVTASPQTVTYIYQADTETVTINFVDQSDGDSLVKQVHVSGNYDTTANFDVNSYVSQHLKGYEVVSSNWPTTGVLLGADSSSQAPYQDVD